MRREDNDVQESLYWEFKIWTIDMHRCAHLFEWETYIPEEFLRTPRPPPVPYIRLRSVAAGVGTVNAITDVDDLVDRAEKAAALAAAATTAPSSPPATAPAAMPATAVAAWAAPSTTKAALRP